MNGTVVAGQLKSLCPFQEENFKTCVFAKSVKARCFQPSIFPSYIFSQSGDPGAFVPLILVLFVLL